MILPLLAALLVGSPDCKLRVVDSAGEPMAGLRVVREWRTSEGREGKEESKTDAKGEVHFARVDTSVSLFTKLLKPLNAFLPVPCGPGSELYGFTTISVYTAKHYTQHFDEKIWRHEAEKGTWVRNDGVWILDPEWHRKTSPSELFQEIGIWNLVAPLDLTLVLFEPMPNQPPQPTR